MQNSIDSTKTLQKDEHEEDISDSDLPKEVPKPGPPNEPSKSEPLKEAPKPESVRTLPPIYPAVLQSKVMEKNRFLRVPQGTLKKLSLNGPIKRLEEISSNSVSEAQTECDDTPKLRQQFTKPRMNRLTEQRIQRLQNAANATVTSTTPRFKRQTSKLCDQISLGSALAIHHSVTDLRTTNDTFNDMLNKLKDLQTKFMQRATTGLPQSNNAIYKLVSLVQNDSCKFVLHKDDSFELPKNLPAESVNDLKICCRQAFDASCKLFLEKLSEVQMAKDQATAELVRKKLEVQMQSEMNNTIEAVEKELEKLYNHNTEESNLPNEIRELKNEIKKLKTSKGHLPEQESLLAKLRSSTEDLKKLLAESQKANKKLSLDLADKNIEISEQVGKIDKHKEEIKVLKQAKKLQQQHLKENEDALIAQKTECAELKQKEKKMLQEMTELTKRFKELSQKLTEKEAELLSGRQLEYSTRTDQAQIKELQMKLELQAGVEKQLHALLEQKQGLLSTLEKKLSKMEDQTEQQRQMIAGRGVRIDTLDSELKKREHENIRKINDLMTLTNDKNAKITQITNELASKNEQLQNLCDSLSVKQSKLHSQEHVIKLLEESNARSVMLHTKLTEKNTLLKDELDHLRRTVRVCVKILIGSNGKNIFEPVPVHEWPKHK